MQNIPGKYWDSLFGISRETQDPGQNFPFSTRLLYGIRNLSRLCYILLVLFILSISHELTLSGDCSKQNVQFPDHISKFLESISCSLSVSLCSFFPSIYFIFLLLFTSLCLPFLCPHVSSFMFLQSDSLPFIFYLNGLVFLII